MQHDYLETFDTPHGVEGVRKDRIILCLHDALCSIPFNSICNMTTFRKNDLLTPPQGTKGVFEDRICACILLYAPFP